MSGHRRPAIGGCPYRDRPLADSRVAAEGVAEGELRGALQPASPFIRQAPFSLQFESNADGHVAGAPRDAFYKSGADGFGLFVAPSLDIGIYRLGGSNGQYAPALTGMPQPFDYDGLRDNG